MERIKKREEEFYGKNKEEEVNTEPPDRTTENFKELIAKSLQKKVMIEVKDPQMIEILKRLLLSNK